MIRVWALIFVSVQLTAGLKLNIATEAGEAAESKPIFYAVIMGKLAYRHQASLWLTSLRMVGGWVGTAVMVTDKPDCLATTLGEAKLLGDKLSSSENVDIYGPPKNCKS